MKTNQLNWKPFAVLAGIVGLLFIILMFVMSFAMLGALNRGIAGPGFGMPWFGWGMGFFWIFPVIGFLIMLTFMFLMMRMMFRAGGPMGWMTGSMSDALHGAKQAACRTCGRAVQTDWQVCPHCGTSLTRT